MRKKNLRKKLMMTGIIVAVVIILALVVFLVIQKKKLDETTAELSEKRLEISNNQQTVYVASKDIVRGEPITLDNVMTQQIYTGLPSTSYMQPDQIGGLATIDIAVNEPIMTKMVTAIEVTQDLRWYEIAVANLMITQKNYDVVDVRILFPNGEDYLVLPKKTVNDLLIDTNIFTVQANEDEILRMASAIIDAYTTTGARIYTTKYIESNIQDEAIPNYPVNPDVIDLINSDPNILDQAIETLNLRARNDLDRRLGKLTKDQLAAVSQGFGLQDTASQTVIRDEFGNPVLEPDDDSLLEDDTTETTNGTADGTSTATEGESAQDATAPADGGFYSETGTEPAG